MQSSSTCVIANLKWSVQIFSLHGVALGIEVSILVLMHTTFALRVHVISPANGLVYTVTPVNHMYGYSLNFGDFLIIRLSQLPFDKVKLASQLCILQLVQRLRCLPHVRLIAIAVHFRCASCEHNEERLACAACSVGFCSVQHVDAMPRDIPEL